ncbi:MAG: pyridoxamine 5'-phosphate oxidase family protein [Solobacterium sp.]|nr:pyridoxamine 5'-phosphate oxidase family protein [Solobacterium sp.]
MSQEECIEILKNEKRGVLSVHGDDGYPYGMPLNHYYCEEDGKLYFHSGMIGHKVDSIRCPTVFMTRDTGRKASGH